MVQLSREGYQADLDDLKERLRAAMKKIRPSTQLSFEPIELTDKILSQGSPTPIELAIVVQEQAAERDLCDEGNADKLKKIPYLRDVQIGAVVPGYPSININIDRERVAQLGLSMNDVSRSLIASTSSSRLHRKRTFGWTQKAGLSYNVQVEIPGVLKMASVNEMKEIPITPNQARPVLSDVADIKQDTTYGEDDNLGPLPMLTVTANLDKKDLGTATHDVDKALKDMGAPPRGMTIQPRGRPRRLQITLDSLQAGLIVAVLGDLPDACGQLPVVQISGRRVIHSACRAGGFAAIGEDHRRYAEPAIVYGDDHVGGGVYFQCRFADHQCRGVAQA